MKKTIVTLVALAGVATATSLSDGVAFTTSSFTMDTTSEVWNDPGASVTLSLNVEAFANLFETATNSARPVFVSMSGMGSNIVGLEAHESDRICGASGVTAGGTYNNLYSLNSNGTSDSISSIDWSSVKGAALTMALETLNNGTTWTLSVLKQDNTYMELTASNPALRWSNMGDISKIDVDKNVVTKAYAFDGEITGATAQGLNHEAIAASIPEPTTATLSLLALMGLAARRRRKVA